MPSAASISPSLCGATTQIFLGHLIFEIDRSHSVIRTYPTGTHVNKWSIRQGGCFLHNKQQTQGKMSLTVFEIMVTPIEGPQTYASDRRVTSFGQQHVLTSLTVRV
jgi:hypothetical protein